MKYVLVIHGGSGTILKENMSASREQDYLHTLENALQAGEKMLKCGQTAVDAVEAAIKTMEDSPLFNAGKGAVFTHDEKNEMDASIMDGRTLAAGSVSGVRRLKNPLSVARKVMENSAHVMLAGEGAEQFAKEQGCEFADASYFYNEERFQQLHEAKKSEKVMLDHSGENEMTDHNGGEMLGTVGAVALDTHGNTAAATSTGGMTNKKFGRIGDTPIIGSGTYANDDTCAVSCTGHGEYFMRNVVAYDMSALMDYKKYTLQQAADFIIQEKLKKQGGEGGLIALDREGNYVMNFNTAGMYRGVIREGHEGKVKIFK
jgi:beta-aspartyl-peptidase (threonine type)